jgi:enoyl-CoA hydratase/carnithine racemase
MMYLGDPIDSQTALQWGLVEQVVPAGTLADEVAKLAKRLAAQPRLALAACKRAIAMGFDLPEQEAIERILPLCDDVSTSPDSIEGVRAFFAKEAPRFA